MFATRPLSDSEAETSEPPLARQLGPRRNKGQQRQQQQPPPWGESGGDKEANRGELAADTRLCVFAWQWDLFVRRNRSSAAAAAAAPNTGKVRNVQPSDCRVKMSAKKKEKRGKTRVCLAAQKSGGGVFTSPPFLLPRAVGNQLLRTGKTPFVLPPPVCCRFKRQSSATTGFPVPTAPSAGESWRLHMV